MRKEGQQPFKYQLQWCVTQDGKNGYMCSGPVAVVASLQCTSPHPCVPFENQQDQPPTSVSNERAESLYIEILENYGYFPNNRSFILQYWDLYQYFYEKGEILQSPEELYQLAEDE